MRGKHVRLENLANDLAQALAREEVREKSLWSDWEMESALNFETRGVYPERYPLTWFAIRLMELAAEPLTAIDLHGHAQRVLEWFNANSERLATYVRGISAQRIEEGQRLATDALLGAVRRDEIAEDLEIIRRELSADRVSAFVSDVYASEFATNPIFRLFDQAGAILHLSMDADGHPDELGIHDLVPKGFLAEMPEGARTHYAQLRGNEWGEGLANGVIQLFCEALSGESSIEASLTSPTSLLEAIDEAASDLNALGELIVVLTGDWMDAIFELGGEDIDGYESLWRIPETERVGEIARYRGNPIVLGPGDGDRRLYVVEAGTWGCFVVAQVEPDQDLVVKISPISSERAREILEENPNHFASEPSEAAKLRKLQNPCGDQDPRSPRIQDHRPFKSSSDCRSSPNKPRITKGPNMVVELFGEPIQATKQTRACSH